MDGVDPKLATASSPPTLGTTPEPNATLPIAVDPVRLDAPAIPGFELLERLGEGGMGVVWKARQISLNRIVAVKLVLGGQHPRANELIRFLAEAEAVAAVRHSHVVQVYEYGEVDGRPFLVLEYLPGGSLTDRLRGSPLAASAAASLIGKLAAAVQAAHDQQIVHRDLKPANVLFDAGGEPRVTDFGLAKRAGGSDLTATHAVMGTPAYMSPEQAKGESKFVGPSADVWALGVILYEALTGTRPFDAPDAWGMLQRVMMDTPTTPRRLVGAIPRDLETVCLKCLEKEPGKRYATAAALADDLGRFLAGQPVAARPPGLAERSLKWVQRNPARAAAVAALGGLLVAAVVLWGLVQAQARTDRIAATVEKLQTADAAAVPALLAELDDFGLEADPHLRPHLLDAGPTASRARLALLSRDRTLVGLVREDLLTATSTEFAVVTQRLRPFKTELIPALWQIVDDPATGHDRRFRAACALAQFDPDNPHWPAVAPTVVDRLLTSGVGDLSTWARQLAAIASQLRANLDLAFQAEAAEGRGALVAAAIAEMAPPTDWLFALVRIASASQLGELMPRCRNDAALRPQLIEALATPLPPPRAEGVLGNWAYDKIVPAHAIRARLALVLIHLEDHPAAWKFLQASPDPQTRSFLIHWLAESRYPLDRLLGRLRGEVEVSTRRAILQAAGEYPITAMTPAEQDRVRRDLLTAFATDPDAGIHSSAEWLLRRWGWFTELPATGLRADRNWYSDQQGHTFAVVRGPTVVRLGSPLSEFGREVSDGGETLRDFRFDRDFAIGLHEVQVSQFCRANPDYISCTPIYGYSPEPDCPAAHVNWASAYNYCRWLTTQAGMTEADQCYREIGPTTFPWECIYPDALLRSGYRLPTEAEWEYACRAGTTSSRYWGDDHGRIADQYIATHPDGDRNCRVGQRKPNDLGLFDVIGNTWELCHDFYSHVRHGGYTYANPEWGGPLRAVDGLGLIRGSSFTDRTLAIRSARRRQFFAQGDSYGDMGMRLARTLRVPTGGWLVNIYHNPNPPEPTPEQWATLIAKPPLRMTRMTDLNFQFVEGGHDIKFAVVAHKTHDGPPGDYRLTATSDDGIRIFIDDRLIVDRWAWIRDYTEDRIVKLQTGSKIRVEYWQDSKIAMLQVAFSPVGK